ETDLRRGFTRGIHLQVTRENPLMTQASRLATPWGAESQALVRDEFKRSMAVLVLNEDLPEAHNRVTLTDRIEADGLPGVKLDYTVSRHTRKA
ncbi:hypothetical protein ABTH29_19455, partial [Acinetobacter baumannii]